MNLLEALPQIPTDLNLSCNATCMQNASAPIPTQGLIGLMAMLVICVILFSAVMYFYQENDLEHDRP